MTRFAPLTIYARDSLLLFAALMLLGLLPTKAGAQDYLPPKAPTDLELTDATLEALTSYDLSDMPGS